jgi:hypothetical protein
MLSIVLLPTLTAAQTTASSPFAATQLWEFGVWGAEAAGKTAGQGFGQTHITMAGFEAGRVIHESALGSGYRRNLEYMIQIQPLFLVTRPQRTYGGGFSPVGLKWNFAPRGRFRPYIEVNGGAMFTQKNVPPGNTDTFNFTAAGGSGVMIALTRTQVLSVAACFWHLSNANLGNINPGFNTIQFVVGYHWLTSGHRHRQQQLSATPSNTQTKE